MHSAWVCSERTKRCHLSWALKDAAADPEGPILKCHCLVPGEQKVSDRPQLTPIKTLRQMFLSVIHFTEGETDPQSKRRTLGPY